MINRTQISGSYLSDIDANGWYTFAVNPVSFDDQDSLEVNIGRTLNGYSFEMLPQFDGRPRTMRWENLPNREPYSTLVGNLTLLKGKETYLKLKDLSKSENNDEQARIRIINVLTVINEGRGSVTSTSKIVYNRVELQFVYI